MYSFFLYFSTSLLGVRNFFGTDNNLMNRGFLLEQISVARSKIISQVDFTGNNFYEYDCNVPKRSVVSIISVLTYVNILGDACCRAVYEVAVISFLQVLTRDSYT
jgi:hypothetical protein